MSVYKRPSGNWYAIVSTGRDANGKICRRSLGTFRTQKEAKSAERKALDSLEMGIDLSPKTVTVAEVMGRYLLDAETRCGAKTLERYHELARKDIVAYIGSLPLLKLKPAHISDWAATLRKSGSKNQGPLSPKSVRHAFNLLNSALRWAVRMQLIGRNACDSVRPPSVPHVEATALDTEEIAKIVAIAKGTRWEAYLALALATGARRGELCALTWADVDLESGHISFSKSLSQVRKREAFVKSTKSGKSREFPLSRFAIEALRRQRAMLAREKLAAGSAYTESNLLFPDALGHRKTPMSATNAISRLARKAGISTTRLHAMRHTAATTMLAAGVDLRTVSSIVGHANASTTLNIYSHVLPKVRNAAIDMLGDQLERAINGDGDESQKAECTRFAPAKTHNMKKPRNHGVQLVAPTGIEPVFTP